MTRYYDHYFNAETVQAFWPLLASEVNIIGPVYDEASQRVHIAVRSTTELPVPEGAEATAPETGITILGVWA